MKDSKFYDVQTNNGYKTININNIALIESSGIGTKITMDVKDENGNYINDGTGNALRSKKVNVSQSVFPLNKPWNVDWYGPLTIPKKGDVITLTEDNLPEYKKLIDGRNHDKNSLIDGKNNDSSRL